MNNTPLRVLDGFSLAAFRTLLTKGSKAARHVMGETVRAAAESERRVNFWDLARGFAVDENVVVHSGSWFDGGTSPLERYLLALLLRYFKPNRILEVGTFRGISTRLILDNSTQSARVFTMDLPPDRDFSALDKATDERLVQHAKVGVEFAAHPDKGRVTQVLGDSMKQETWDQVVGGIDFAFIDASHSYEAVKNDTQMARAKLAPNAVMLWHDYTQEDSYERGVGRFIREEMQRHRDIFVVPSTSLAIRIPEAELVAADKRVAGFFHAGDYGTRRPGGLTPWL
ncbi:MAG: class I SAM-dependent methyltransferase, partial [Deltaproteobacteria bacterium]|nr:class I SAM-dependent methyltransferase [Deltaproteobacteria bacterium]